MKRMIKAFYLAIEALGDARILKVLAKSLAITLLLCVLIGLAAGWAAPLLGGAYAGELSANAGLVSALMVALMIFFGFRVIAIPVIGLFADEIVSAVEQKHYPQAAMRAQRVGVGLSLRLGLMSALRALLVNLAATPLYLILLITAIGPIALFILLNGFLLGRDLGEMVAVRHLDGAGAREWLNASRGTRLLLGLAAAGLFMIPIVNILAPIVGAAMATHIFHDPRYRGLIGG
jgi:CysZ protein